MSKLVQILKYLQDSGGEKGKVDVTEKLKKLGFKTEDEIFDFLNPLTAKKYIYWDDERPRIPDSFFVGGIQDPRAPLHFTAKLSIEGGQYLDERKLKTGSNIGTYIGAGSAVVFGIATLILSIRSNTQKGEIKLLNDKLLTQGARLDSVLSANKTLRGQAERAQQLLPKSIANYSNKAKHTSTQTANLKPRK